MALRITVDGRTHSVAAAADTPLLCVLRNNLTPVAAGNGKTITTIATGTRMRDLPFTREHVKAVLA